MKVKVRMRVRWAIHIFDDVREASNQDSDGEGLGREAIPEDVVGKTQGLVPESAGEIRKIRWDRAG